MTGATASAAGTSGLTPAPSAGSQGKYLRGDGTWQTPPNTTYSAATASANGLMSAADKAKLDGVAAGANNYTHPTSAGSKHIPGGGASGQILRWSADGTAAWGADNNTTYSAATASANGLMSAADKAKLDAFGSASAYALKTEISHVIYEKSRTTISVPASGWTTNTQGWAEKTIDIMGLAAEDDVDLAVQGDQIGNVLLAGARCDEAGKLTIICLAAPTAAFSLLVRLKGVRG